MVESEWYTATYSPLQTLFLESLAFCIFFDDLTCCIAYVGHVKNIKTTQTTHFVHDSFASSLYLLLVAVLSVSPLVGHISQKTRASIMVFPEKHNAHYRSPHKNNK